MASPWAAIIQAGAKLGADATNKKREFDTNIFRLLGSHVTGRQPNDFSSIVQNDSVATAAKGIQGFQNAQAEQANNEQKKAQQQQIFGLLNSGAVRGEGEGGAFSLGDLTKLQGLLGR